MHNMCCSVCISYHHSCIVYSSWHHCHIVVNFILKYDWNWLSTSMLEWLCFSSKIHVITSFPISGTIIFNVYFYWAPLMWVWMLACVILVSWKCMEKCVVACYKCYRYWLTGEGEGLDYVMTHISLITRTWEDVLNFLIVKYQISYQNICYVSYLNLVLVFHYW